MDNGCLASTLHNTCRCTELLPGKGQTYILVYYTWNLDLDASLAFLNKYQALSKLLSIVIFEDIILYKLTPESGHNNFLCQSLEILWYAQARKTFTVASHTRLWHAKVSKSMLITSLKQCSPGSLGIFHLKCFIYSVVDANKNNLSTRFARK